MKTYNERFARPHVFEELDKAMESIGLSKLYQHQAMCPPHGFYLETGGTHRLSTFIYHRPGTACLIVLKLLESHVPLSLGRNHDPYTQHWSIDLQFEIEKSRLPVRERSFRFKTASDPETVQYQEWTFDDNDRFETIDFRLGGGSLEEIGEDHQLICQKLSSWGSNKRPYHGTVLAGLIQGWMAVLNPLLVEKFSKIWALFDEDRIIVGSKESFWSNFPKEELGTLTTDGNIWYPESEENE